MLAILTDPQLPEGMAATRAVILAALALILYFLPAAAAWKKPQFSSVMVINLFLGWTLIGWVVALAWGLQSPSRPSVTVQQQQPTAPGPAILCRSCGKYSFPGSLFCSACGAKLE